MYTHYTECDRYVLLVMYIVCHIGQ